MTRRHKLCQRHLYNDRKQRALPPIRKTPTNYADCPYQLRRNGNRIPAHLFQLRAALRGLERIHGHDDAREVSKGVLRCRQLLANLLNALAIQTDQRDGEERLQLLLELLHNVLRRNDGDALSPTAADELRQDHANLQCLTQANSICEQHARANALT